MKRKSVVSLLHNACAIAVAALLFACSSGRKIDTNYLYFQKNLDSMGTVVFTEPMLKKNDLLSIQVYNKGLNQQEAAVFNIQASSGSATSGLTAQYVIGQDGTIELPVIGKIKAEGLTKTQLEQSLINQISPYVKDPHVIVKFLNFNVNILGEVKTPGIHTFTTERVTILDAIGVSGDLTSDGKRQDVLVIREDSANIRKSYTVDLRDAALFKSPAFQLQPNDIVYVGATDRKLKSLNANPQSGRGLQIALSLISALATIATIITVTKQ